MINSQELCDLALFLGMFAGDGSLPAKHNGEGYRNYQVCFYNTNKHYVDLFQKLFIQLTGVHAEIKVRERKNKKPLWQLEKYSKKAFDLIHDDWQIPDGKKARKVFVPSFILSSNNDIKKHFFLGLLITDGCVKKDMKISFHCASEKLLKNISELIFGVWGIRKEVRSFNQKGFKSYQLNLNKGESQQVLKDLPRWHNLVLR